MKVSRNERHQYKKRRLMILIMFILIIGLAAPGVKTFAQTSDNDGDGVPDYRDNCPSTPNPEKIAFEFVQGDNYEIYSMNADGSNRINLTNNDAVEIQPSYSHNGSQIVFTSERDGDQEIYVMNSDGSNPVRLTDSGGNSYPAFSPDGSKIVFTSFRDGNFEIYMMNADGSNQINLTANEAFDYTPSFSPDGNKIVFASLREGVQEIYEMNTDGSDLTRLTHDFTGNFAPSFSPDGEKIVFTSIHNGNNLEIHLMNADGSDQIRLTDSPDLDGQASFSPDGSKIVFTSQRDGNFEIYVMNTDGSDQTNLTNTMQIGELAPSWGAQADSDNDDIGDACENTAPTIETFNITRQEGTSVYPLAIAQVFDPDETIRSMTITVNGGASATVNGVTVSDIDNSFAIGIVRARVSAACGATNASFTLRVTDSGGLYSEETLHVVVLPERSPPVINLRSTAITLFPPDHEYTTISVNRLVESVSDNCSELGVSDVKIHKVTSDEADNAPGGGDGNTINDIVIAAGCRSVKLRAEREGSGNGRVYTITMKVRDAAGNTTQAKYKVRVPKSQNGFPAIEDEAHLTINGGCSF